LLDRYGHRVRLSDQGALELEPGTAVEGVERGGHTIEFLQPCDLVVASPGVRMDSPILDELHRRGIYVMSSLELAYQIAVRANLPASSSLIAVTGTIGKRTTVELLQRLFAATGRKLMIGGNRGRPLSDLLLDRGGADPIALAVSSFQLETVVHFRPQIAVFLNVDEAHLDRHKTIAEYVRIKSRIFMNQRPDDVLILPFDDPRLRRLARKHQGRTFFVSARQAVERGAWLEGGRLCMNLEGKTESVDSPDAPFPEDVLAAVLAARLAGLSLGDIATACAALPGMGDAA
jgi:UDP-N-acetylmuramoylalanine--D-glutamate ligase